MQLHSNPFKRVVWIGFVTIGVFILFFNSYKIFGNKRDMFVGNDFEWQAILDEPHRVFTILCNGGSYMLTYDPPDMKTNSGGVAIGSSAKDLEGFCGKIVMIGATGRSFRDKPLCTKQLQKDNPVFCNGKIPVVDIHEISEPIE